MAFGFCRVHVGVGHAEELRVRVRISRELGLPEPEPVVRLVPHLPRRHLAGVAPCDGLRVRTEGCGIVGRKVLVAVGLRGGPGSAVEQRAEEADLLRLRLVHQAIVRGEVERALGGLDLEPAKIAPDHDAAQIERGVQVALAQEGGRGIVAERKIAGVRGDAADLVQGLVRRRAHDEARVAQPGWRCVVARVHGRRRRVARPARDHERDDEERERPHFVLTWNVRR